MSYHITTAATHAAAAAPSCLRRTAASTLCAVSRVDLNWAAVCRQLSSVGRRGNRAHRAETWTAASARAAAAR